MLIIHLSNTIDSKNGGGIYEVVSNIIKSMQLSKIISQNYLVNWANFPYKILFKNRSKIIIHRHGLWSINSLLLLLLIS